MTRKRRPTQMARLVAQWRESGDSQAGFARRHQIPAWTFWYWCRKLSPVVAPTAVPRAEFVPVHVTAEPVTATVEIVLTGGERIHVRAGASAESVHAAVAAVRAAC